MLRPELYTWSPYNRRGNIRQMAYQTVELIPSVYFDARYTHYNQSLINLRSISLRHNVKRVEQCRRVYQKNLNYLQSRRGSHVKRDLTRLNRSIDDQMSDDDCASILSSIDDRQSINDTKYDSNDCEIVSISDENECKNIVNSENTINTGHADSQESQACKRKIICNRDANQCKLTAANMKQRNESAIGIGYGITTHNWDNLSWDIWELFSKLRQTSDLLSKKAILRESIYKTISARLDFPVDLYMVGSSCNGLAASTSDVDLCLVIGGTQAPSTRDGEKQHLKRVKSVLESLPYIKNTQLINAKVPILKFFDTVSRLEADLNINNVVGIRNTQLIGCYSRLDWRVQPLVIVAKTWASINQINNAQYSTLSSYTIVLMMIHYLQYGCSPPVLPCLHSLMKDSFKPDSDVKELSLFVDLPEWESKNASTVGDLFIGFLDYFGNKFDYEKNAISIREGKTLPIETCRQTVAPKNSPVDWRFFGVEEPFELTNTARSIYIETAFNSIIDVFRRCHRKIIDNRTLYSVMIS